MIQFLIQLQGEKSARNLFCSIVAAKKPLILHNGILDLVSIVIKLLDVDVVERNSKASSPMKGSELEKKAERSRTNASTSAIQNVFLTSAISGVPVQ